VVGVLDTGMIEVRGRECSCMKGGTKDSFVFALCALMDYSIIDIDVTDVLGNARPVI